MSLNTPIYKVILVGSNMVGKTSLISMYVKGICGNPLPTIGVEFCTKEIQLEDGTIVKAQLWDTAGQERFKSISMNYYRRAMGILLLFDVTEKTSFDSCKQILEDVRNNSDENCVVYLIGNKIDLVDKRIVTTKEAQDFANKENIKYIETSATKNVQVNKAFVEVLNDVHKVRTGKVNENKEIIHENLISLENREEKIRSKKEEDNGCC